MHLLSADFRCICLDPPGTGLSDRVPTAEINLDRSAQAVTTVIEQLGLEDLALVVHDLGGLAGIDGAYRSSTARQRIRGIVAINTFAWHPTERFLRVMLTLIGSPIVREFDVVARLIPRLTASNFGAGRTLDKPSRTTLRAGMDSAGRRVFHQYMHDAATCDAVYERVHRALAFDFTALPVLTIFGQRNDPLGFQARWRQLFPTAQQVVVAGGNHFPMCDDPELVARTIRSWHQSHVLKS